MYPCIGHELQVQDNDAVAADGRNKRIDVLPSLRERLPAKVITQPSADAVAELEELGLHIDRLDVGDDAALGVGQIGGRIGQQEAVVIKAARKLGVHDFQAIAAGQVFPVLIVGAELPLHGRIVELLAQYRRLKGNGRAVFADVGDLLRKDEGLWPAGSEGDIVQGQVVAKPSGGVVAQGEPYLGLVRTGGEGEAVGIPFFVLRHLARGVAQFVIDEKRNVGLDKAGATGLNEVDDIRRELV